MKLLIAIPTMDMVPVQFLDSILKLTRKLERDGVAFDIEIESGTLIHMARDKLACKAINNGYTHVLWLDSDMVFSDSIVEDLQFCGQKFVTGIAHGRRSPFMSCLFKSLDLSAIERWELKDYPKDTFEVAGCGMACVLIDVQILKEVQFKFNTCFMPILSYGEDLSFCKRAVSMGYHIYAEPAVRLGHVSHLTVWPDDSERFASKIHDLH